MTLKTLHHTTKKLLALGLLLILFIVFTSQSDAQTTDDGWTVPVNLSQSGSATDPQLVMDASGTMHVLWLDAAAESFIYLQGRPGDWSEPVPVGPPFGTRQYFPNLLQSAPTPLFSPKLTASADGRIHAFWIDDQTTLRHSWVSSGAFTDFSAWSSRVKLAESVSDFSVALDDTDQLYLSYIGLPDAETLQPGVNFLRFDSAEGNWSAPLTLYESNYFQKLPPERTNIQMAADTVGGASQIYIAWDNRPLEKLFFARSDDGGLSWEDPLIIDQRKSSDEPDTIGPTNITLAADAMEVILVWHAGHGVQSCSQYYQYSTDGGHTWSTPAIISEELDSCPEQSQLLGKVADGSMILSTIHQGLSYLLAWDGSRWSDPQLQETLGSFDNSETYRPVDLECHQLSLIGDNQIMAIGCGKGSDDQTADIWQTLRSLEEIETWFSLPPAWSSPVLVSGDAAKATLPEMVVDDQGMVHAFWSQPLETNDPRTAVFYSRWDGERWNSPLPAVTSPTGNAERPKVVVSDDNRLMVIWLNELGEIIFSQVSTDQAAFTEDWSAPITLPSLNKKVGKADIELDRDGIINVAFSIPVNENRGIYLTRSEDLGESWQEPILVFDGLDAAWDVVGEPHVVTSDDGVLHLLWAKQSLLADELAAQALYYTRSVDQGETFDEPQIVAEVPISWFGLDSSGSAAVVHRFWQEQLASNTIVRHDYSVDDGRTWSDPLQVSSKPGPIGITADSSGQLHAVQREAGEITYYTWDGGGWRLGEGAGLLLFSEDGVTGQPQGINTAISLDQTLVALYTNDLNGSENIQPSTNLFAAWRNIEAPEAFSIPIPIPSSVAGESNPAPVPTAGATPMPSVTSTPRPLSTSTVDAANNFESSQGIPSNPNNSNGTFRLAIAFVPVGLFLILVVSIGLWVRRDSRN